MLERTIGVSDVSEEWIIVVNNCEVFLKDTAGMLFFCENEGAGSSPGKISDPGWQREQRRVSRPVHRVVARS